MSMKPRAFQRVGWTIMRVTRKNNFLKPSTVKGLIDVLIENKDKSAVWFSPPCTGGCRWNVTINQNKSDALAKQVRDQQVIFSRLWKSFCMILETVTKYGCPVFWETPASNAFLRTNYVKATLAKYKFARTTVSGCMFGQALLGEAMLHYCAR